MMTHHHRKKPNRILGLAVAIACTVALWCLAWAIVEASLKFGAGL